MMQNEQRLLQPSWTLRLGRVFDERIRVEHRGGHQFGVGEDVADDQLANRHCRSAAKRNKSGTRRRRRSVVGKLMLVRVSDHRG